MSAKIIDGKMISAKKGLALYIGCCIITWFGKNAKDAVTINFGIEANSYVNFLEYTSPTVIFAAVFLLLVFRNLKLKPRFQNVIAAVSPAAFGVYLIHWHPHFREYFLQDRFAMIANMNPATLIFAAMGAAFCVFACCIVVDYLRYRVFLLLGVRRRLEKLECKLNEKVNSL